MSRGGARRGAGRPKGSKSKPKILEEEYANDTILLKFYKRKLLKRGWAGTLSASERDYLKRIRTGL